MKILSTFILLIFITTSSISFSQEKAEKHSILTDKLNFGIGSFFPSKSMVIVVDGSLPSEDIEFDEAFGFGDRQATFFANFDWRFSKKWKLSVEYFGVNNSGKIVLQEDIDWDDLIFEEGTNVKAGINSKVYRIFFGRIFSSGQKHEFGAGLGIHAINMSVFIEGDVLTNEGDLSFEKSRKTITLPLPNLGLWYFYAPNKKWAFTARLDVFALTIGDLSGRLWDITPGIKYQIFKHIGVALNYNYLNIGASFDTSAWRGDVDQIIQGPSLRITGNF